jgi:GH18 family chitinase
MESKDFSDMVKTRENREKFITHAIEFLRLKGFDGLDLGNENE